MEGPGFVCVPLADVARGPERSAFKPAGRFVLHNVQLDVLLGFLDTFVPGRGEVRACAVQWYAVLGVGQQPRSEVQAWVGCDSGLLDGVWD